MRYLILYIHSFLIIINTREIMSIHFFLSQWPRLRPCKNRYIPAPRAAWDWCETSVRNTKCSYMPTILLHINCHSSSILLPGWQNLTLIAQSWGVVSMNQLPGVLKDTSKHLRTPLNIPITIKSVKILSRPSDHGSLKSSDPPGSDSWCPSRPL